MPVGATQATSVGSEHIGIGRRKQCVSDKSDASCERQVGTHCDWAMQVISVGQSDSSCKQGRSIARKMQVTSVGRGSEQRRKLNASDRNTLGLGDASHERRITTFSELWVIWKLDWFIMLRQANFWTQERSFGLLGHLKLRALRTESWR